MLYHCIDVVQPHFYVLLLLLSRALPFPPFLSATQAINIRSLNGKEEEGSAVWSILTYRKGEKATWYVFDRPTDRLGEKKCMKKTPFVIWCVCVALRELFFFAVWSMFSVIRKEGRESFLCAILFNAITPCILFRLCRKELPFFTAFEHASFICHLLYPSYHEIWSPSQEFPRYQKWKTTKNLFELFPFPFPFFFNFLKKHKAQPASMESLWSLSPAPIVNILRALLFPENSSQKERKIRLN